MSGGRPGFVIGLRPRRYENTRQQRTIKEAAKFCGIEKGITRRELVEKMTKCIPQWFKDNKGQEEVPPAP